MNIKRRSISIFLVSSMLFLTGCGNSNNSGNGKKGYKNAEDAAIAAAETLFPRDIETMLQDIAPPGFLEEWAKKSSLNTDDVISAVDKELALESEEEQILKSEKINFSIREVTSFDTDKKAKINKYMTNLGVEFPEDMVEVEVLAEMPQKLKDEQQWSDQTPEFYCFQYDGKWYGLWENMMDLEDLINPKSSDE